MRPWRFDAADERLASAAWSLLAEPGDRVASGVVRLLGAAGALAWLADVHAADGTKALRGLVDRAGPDGPDELAARWGSEAPTPRRVAAALERWGPRRDGLDPRRDLDVLDRLGGRLVMPSDADWPGRLADLGGMAPLCLWVRGRCDMAAMVGRSVAVVGARAATAYGERVAAELAGGVARRGATVVSGGAYGIDAAAHRGALHAGGATVVLLAGGVDRLYPAGNRALLERVLTDGGAVLAEVPPGATPTRSRFLLRNRLIAALSPATVVVEAATRSGALSTAMHAARMYRPVGAVPGPVTSMASAGCHLLLREGVAVCVTDAEEVMELAGTMGADLAPSVALGSRAGVGPAGGAGDALDDLSPVQRRVLEAFPVRGVREELVLARAAGLGPREVRASLGVLELWGVVERVDDGWRRALR